jgi:arginyl-tRNA synthetase
MKERLHILIEDTIKKVLSSQQLNDTELPPFQVNVSRQTSHGDYSTNVAFVLAKRLHLAPNILAKQLIDALPAHSYIAKIEIAGHGFINFFLNDDAQHPIITDILQKTNRYGYTNLGQNKKVLVEFVSTNPTGPLHIGHGRHAAYGDVVSNLLETLGYQVEREYYLNDSGRQVDIIAVSVWLRYLAMYNEVLPYPTHCYQGEYIQEIATDLKEQFGDRFKTSATNIADTINLQTYTTPDDSSNSDAYIDALAEHAKQLFGKNTYQILQQQSLQSIIDDIKDDLTDFGVNYDTWFSEKTLVDEGAVQHAVEALAQKKLTFTKDNALWFKSTDYGDTKDRVLIRSNGQHTYFASDVAYHFHKIRRGYDWLIDILGADHHGYIPRITGIVDALGFDVNHFDIKIVQMVSLYRGGQVMRMSTRRATYVTLRELREEIGNDAVRFFYIMQKMDQPLNFDIDLALAKSNDNPVYYIQYAHARICSLFRQMDKQSIKFDQKNGLAHLTLLSTSYEKKLIDLLAHYPEILQTAAKQLEPHRITHYLKQLVHHFHSYYNEVKFLTSEANHRDARLCLIQAVQQIIINGLTLIGVSTPEVM